MNSSIDNQEIKQFNKPNQDWWDEYGSFSALHKITPCRINYIIQVIKKNIKRQENYGDYEICQDLKILDIGCGGGILCEPLSRLGGQVTGIDVSENAILSAKTHAQTIGLDIDYKCISIEDFNSKSYNFDLVIASEVIEHVSNRKHFLQMLKQISSNETSIIITTINKSLPGIVFGKFAAEYILNLIPKNTHDWNKFISPNNLYSEAKECGIILNNFVGFVPDLVKNDFKLSSYLGINYAASGIILK